MLRGKAGEVIVDNASEFRSHAMEAAARHAGFSVSFCPIKKPRYRAICERAIDTINTKLCRDLPGHTLTIHDARRLGYDAEDHAVVMLDELEAVANQIVADYNTSPHDGIGDRQPALVFEQDLNKYGINNFADIESFRRDTMNVEEDAQISPSGLRAFGLRYHDIEAVPALLNDLVPLEPRRKRRDDATATVHFRYDPADINTIMCGTGKAANTSNCSALTNAMRMACRCGCIRRSRTKPSLKALLSTLRTSAWPCEDSLSKPFEISLQKRLRSCGNE